MENGNGREGTFYSPFITSEGHNYTAHALWWMKTLRPLGANTDQNSSRPESI